MNRKQNIWWAIIIIAIMLLLVLIFDYFNVPTSLGINIDNFNMDVQAMILNAIVSVVIFLTAYHLVDSWDTRKHQNQQKTAKMLLKTTYRLCKSYILELDKPYASEFLIWSKSGVGEGKRVVIPSYEKYEKIPFDYDDTLMQYFFDGTLSSQHLQTYVKIKNLYATYVNLYPYWFESEEKMKTLNELKTQLLTDIPNAIAELQ